MTPVEIDGANMHLRMPEHMINDGNCIEIVPARGGLDRNEQPYIETAWMPNYEDMQALKAGRPIIFRLSAPFYPPVAMYTLDEDGNPNV